ncbi:Magnesium and cobalt efflux protein CorC [Gimesia alba]|uniref:Magnesium and cobalt efflux protein CorC n=1 Tax=Gimesia alba TaxID=2527973 RepID=A0A517RIG0_9PLAN|nr:hemolysin family protein [Gimesia alba]QDT43650.1 Magnesium and cobalt efflux protein CorC [Gimesia alba]
MVWLLGSIIVFIALSGLMAAVDAAVLSVSHPEIDEMIQSGKHGAGRLREVKQKLTHSLAVIVILTNLINVLGPILVSQQAFKIYGPKALVPITIVLMLGTIVFSEVIPKALGSHYAPLLARWSAPVIRVLGFAIYPLSVGLAWLSDTLKRGQRRIGTETQIRALVKLGQKGGHIEPTEGHMIFRTFRLNDRMVQDIMTPLEKVVSIPAATTVSEAADIIRTKEFSRYPIFGESPDDVQGMLIARDVLSMLSDDKAKTSITSIIHTPFFVSTEMRADKLLLEFRTRHQHLAVVQQSNQTVGIVTLEDVLEEIVGEIEDEKDFGLR